MVIAIIAVLAAMLLPALAQSKMKAQQIRCISNLKQLTLSGSMYASDTGGFISYSDPTLPNTLWMGTLINYYSRVEMVRLCPMTKEPTPLPADSNHGDIQTAWTWYASPKTYAGGYAINGWLYKEAVNYRTDVPNNEVYYFKKETGVQKPSQTPFFVDCSWVDLWPWETDQPYTDLYSPQLSNPPMIGRCVMPRHGWKSPGCAPRNQPVSQPLPGAIDAALVDGHVELAKLESLWSYYWHVNYNPPSKRPGLH